MAGSIAPSQVGLLDHYPFVAWANACLEYYIIENWSYNACSVSGATQLGTVTSDGSQYQVCKVRVTLTLMNAKWPEN
jgi:hypothetical protein